MTPRVHGNGFLQLDLPDGRRLHVWDDELPRQTVSSSIHDHVFGFKSLVLCGELTHLEYEAESEADGAYDVLAPQRRDGTEDTKLGPTGERVNLVETQRLVVPAGSEYHFAPLKFHDTKHQGTTATVIAKTHRLDGVEPRILIPHGERPDNHFDREAFSPDDLWLFVDRALVLAKERGRNLRDQIIASLIVMSIA